MCGRPWRILVQGYPYRPQSHIESHRTLSLKALVRWHHLRIIPVRHALPGELASARALLSAVTRARGSDRDAQRAGARAVSVTHLAVCLEQHLALQPCRSAVADGSDGGFHRPRAD